jgi:hypothetical protein
MQGYQTVDYLRIYRSQLPDRWMGSGIRPHTRRLPHTRECGSSPNECDWPCKQIRNQLPFPIWLWTTLTSWACIGAVWCANGAERLRGSQLSVCHFCFSQWKFLLDSLGSPWPHRWWQSRRALFRWFYSAARCFPRLATQDCNFAWCEKEAPADSKIVISHDFQTRRFHEQTIIIHPLCRLWSVNSGVPIWSCCIIRFSP